MPSYIDPSGTQPVSTVQTVGALPKPGKALQLMMVASLLAVLGAGFLWFQNQRTVQALDDVARDRAIKEQEFAAFAPVSERIQEIESQAAVMRDFYNQQKDWDRILSGFQSRLFKQMEVLSLEVDVKTGDARMIAKTDSFANFAKIYKAFTDEDGQKFFATVQPTAVTEKDGGVEFTFDFQFTPTALPAVTSPLSE